MPIHDTGMTKFYSNALYGLSRYHYMRLIMVHIFIQLHIILSDFDINLIIFS